MIIHRNATNLVEKSLTPGKVIVLYGPRQVGKTTLIRILMEKSKNKIRYINTDELIYRDVLSSQNVKQLSDMIGNVDLIIIDEAQRIENIGLNLKLIVDNFPDLMVVATGSASFDLANKISEPLTGRKLTFALYPVSYSELQKTLGHIEARNQLERWLIWGGYPEIVTTGDIFQRERLIGELVTSYLYRDILELEDIRQSSKLVDLLRLLAFQIGSEVSISKLASRLAINYRTVQRYLDLLQKVFVIYKVQGFSRNLRKEISKNARFYFYDNGVRNALINNFNELRLRDDIGQLWENYLMIERLKANQVAGRFVNTFFWRTYDQKEIDCIEERRGKLFGFEFKYRGGGSRKATKQEFLETYPGAKLETITTENFESFLT
jgi:uncharacterized protein